MSPFKVVVFDLGNVLIPFDHTIAAKRFDKIFPGLGDKYLRFYKEKYELHRSFERGDISQQEFLEIFMNLLDNKIDEDTFCRISSEIFVVNEDVVALLPFLKQDYRLVLLSNTNAIHQKYGWAQYSFLQKFEKLILSHEVHAVKPEEKIYKAVEAYTGEVPSAHIFIDDIKEYGIGAIKCGWDAIHFVGYDDLLANLKSREILKLNLGSA